MATTTRKKKEVEVLKPEQKDFLSEEHLRNLEIKSRDVEVAKYVMAVEEQALENMQLKLQILSSNIEKQRSLLRDKAARYESAKNKYTLYKKEIWPQYGLNENEGLGYDPESGRIVKQ